MFVEPAIFLAKGGDIEKLGDEYHTLKIPSPFLPTIENSVINGCIAYIDSFGNAITNISNEIFETVSKGRRFEILIQSNYNKIKTLNKFYYETPSGELLALFNSTGMLEIAINKGNVSQLLNLSINAVVRIKFYDKPEREDLKLI